MPRPPKPWWNAQKGAWYCWIDGKRVRLAVDKADATIQFHRLMAARGVNLPGLAPPGYTVLDVFNLFVDHVSRAVSRGERSRVTLEGYERYLPRAAEAIGGIAASELRPHHVETWLDSEPRWGPTSRYNAITAIKAAFRWANRSGHLETNPLAHMERPTPKRRERIPTEADLEAWRTAWSDQAGRDLLQALVESGCRPGEVYRLTARDVDLEAGTWSVIDKIRHKTGEERRTVHLTPSLVNLSRRLVERWPEGPIFRNRSGRPWTRNAVACRFARLRARGVASPGDVAYALRHLYVTDALERGVDVATVAALVGHKDATMILRVYSKLRQRSEHLRRAAIQVRPS